MIDSTSESIQVPSSYEYGSVLNFRATNFPSDPSESIDQWQVTTGERYDTGSNFHPGYTTHKPVLTQSHEALFSMGQASQSALDSGSTRPKSRTKATKKGTGGTMTENAQDSTFKSQATPRKKSKNTKKTAIQDSDNDEAMIPQGPLTLDDYLIPKFQQAAAVIATQKEEDALEKKMGAEITITPFAKKPISGVFWRAPQNDDTIPTTDEEEVFLVFGLTAAIYNSQSCLEKDASGTFMRRWADGATYYTDHEISQLAWKLLVSNHILIELAMSR